MRVPETLLTSVGYINEVTYRDATGVVEGDPVGTGFFAIVKSPAGRYWHFFVTAKHVTDDLKGKELYIIVNKIGGGVAMLTDVADAWLTHPNDPTCDVAVLPCNVAPDMDVKAVPWDMFLTPERMKELLIGIGDEVFMVGVFTPAADHGANSPIVRHGNLAMLPNEQIQTELGFADVYLVEARSTGGMSGCPVFVRETAYVPTVTPTEGEKIVLHGVGRMFFLGLMHGHWDIKESQINKYTVEHDRARGVNIGIAIVVPAHKILETILQPATQEAMARDDMEHPLKPIPTPDDKSR